MITALVAAIVSALAAVGSFIAQAIQTIRSVPWRTIFVWSLVVGFFTYFSAIVWQLGNVTLAATRMIFQSASIQSGTPADFQNSLFSFSALWTSLQALLPEFHRFFFWFLGGDWLVWLGVNGLHFALISFLLTKFARPISRFVHFVSQSL